MPVEPEHEAAPPPDVADGATAIPPTGPSPIARVIAAHVPIVAWLPAYPRDRLRRDLVAAVTSWVVMVPVAMGYAELAGVPPEYGLVTAFAALAAYAVFGTSRHLKVTTSSTMAIMSASVVAAIAGGDGARYLELSAALAVIVGVILLAAGVIRLGFIADFLTKSVVTGFVFGLAITIIIGQLPKLFGVPSGGEGSIEQLQVLVSNLPQTNPWTLAVGAGSLALILVLRALRPRFPGPLVALAAGIVAVSAFDLVAHGVSVVGEVATGLPGVSLPAISLLDIPYLAAGAGGIVFLAVGESVGAGRAFAARHHYEIDPDQELIGLGAANVSSGMFGGFTVDASLSQSATAEAAGGRSQLSSLVTAALVLMTAAVLAPLFRNLPNAVLGAIVIAAVLSLMDVGELRRYWATRRADAILAGVALVGVVTTTVLVGLVIAVLLSLMLLLYKASRPYVAVLGQLPGQPATYVDLERHATSEPIPGLLMLRIDGPLYFFNATAARSEILEMAAATTPRPDAVLLDIGATAEFDITTADLMRNLINELHEQSLDVLLAQVKGAVRDGMRRTRLMDVVGEDRVYLSVAQAVDDYRRRHAGPESADLNPPASRPEDPTPGLPAEP